MPFSSESVVDSQCTDVCLTFALIHVMLEEGYDVSTDDHPDLAVELNGISSFNGRKDIHKSCSAVHYFLTDFTICKLNGFQLLSRKKKSNGRLGD